MAGFDPRFDFCKGPHIRVRLFAFYSMGKLFH
jgi:hypothetical protein